MNKHLVLQTDFGLVDGAVSAMYGVALSVNPDLKVFDLTHEITPYNIWEGSYRLYQTITYWPKGTVFVSVVDPGVGTDRSSIIAKTTDGKYIVTPDNGTLTHVYENIGIEEIREIDENTNRLPNSGESYTFHGRDVYAYTGARLAAGIIDFDASGRRLEPKEIVLLDTPQPEARDGIVSGVIDILDVRFGNLWTNICRELFVSAGIAYGDVLEVTIAHNNRQVYKSGVVYGRSFAETSLGEPLVYVNSLNNLGIAINQGSFAKAYNIRTGSNWTIELRKKELS